MGTGYERVATDEAPQAIGPYSQAVVAGDHVFCSGQIALDHVSGDMLASGVAEQTRLVLNNLGAVLEAAGSGLDHVLRCTVYMKDLSAFGDMNTVYGEFFKEPYPARATVEVAGLPKGGLVEIDAIALRPRSGG